MKLQTTMRGIDLVAGILDKREKLSLAHHAMTVEQMGEIADYEVDLLRQGETIPDGDGGTTTIGAVPRTEYTGSPDTPTSEESEDEMQRQIVLGDNTTTSPSPSVVVVPQPTQPPTTPVPSQRSGVSPTTALLGTLGAGLLGASTLGVGLGLGSLLLGNRASNTTTRETKQQDVEIRFFDEDGNRVPVTPAPTP